jgi:LysM repeat protein
MNSPLIPQGSNLEQESQARSNLRTKVFVALGVNVAVLLALLLTPGCKREQPVSEPVAVDPYAVDTNTMYAADTNIASNVADTNYYQAQPVEPVPPVPPTPPPVASEYTIQKGDSFSTIAPKFGVSVKALRDANPNVDPTKLQIGKKLNIPSPSATIGVAAPGTADGGTVVDVSSGEKTYVVKSGDTLGKLATEFHTTVKAIQSANNLPDTKIKVGQKLKIPAKSSQ